MIRCFPPRLLLFIAVGLLSSAPLIEAAPSSSPTKDFLAILDELKDLKIQLDNGIRVSDAVVEACVARVNPNWGDREQLELSEQFGHVFKRMGEFDRAIEYGQRCIDLATRLGDKLLLSRSHMQYADILRWKQDLEGMEKYLQFAEEIDLELENYAGLAEVYNIRGNVLKSKKQDSASIAAYRKALEYAKLAGTEVEIARLSSNLGNALRRTRDFAEAMHLFKRAYEFYRHEADPSEAGRQLEKIGSLASALYEYGEAFDAHFKALDIYNQVSNQQGEIRVLLELSKIYRRLGYYDKAIEHAYNAIDVSEEINYTRGIGDGAREMSYVLCRIGDFNEALNYAQRMLITATVRNDERNIAAAHRNIAEIYINQGRTAESKAELDIAFASFQKLKDIPGIASTKVLYGELNMILDRVTKAEKNYNEALGDYRSIGDPGGEALVLIELGEYFIEIDQFEKAVSSLKDGLELAKEIGDQTLLASSYRLLFQVEEKNNPDVPGIEYASNYFALMEKTHSDVVQSKIAELRTLNEMRKRERKIQALEAESRIQELEVSAKENEIAILNREKEINEIAIVRDRLELDKVRSAKTFFYWLTASASLLCVALGFLFYYSQKMRKVLEEKNTQIFHQNKELKSVNDSKDKFFVVLGHDLKDSVGSLMTSMSMLDENKDSFEGDELTSLIGAVAKETQSTYTLLHNLVDWAKIQMGKSEPNFEVISPLLTARDVIADLDGLLERKELSLECDIDPSQMALSDQNMLTTILRNLIKNAVKFTPPKGRIRVFGVRDDSAFYIHIQDSGIGIPADKIERLFDLGSRNSTLGTAGEKGSGLGLIICKELVEKNGGSLFIKSQPGEGSDFYFSLALPGSDRSRSVKKTG